MISTIRLAYDGRIRRRRHRSLESVVLFADVSVEIPEYDDAGAPVRMWAVTPAFPEAGRRCIRDVGGSLFEPVLLRGGGSPRVASDVFDRTSEPAGRKGLSAVPAAAPAGLVFSHELPHDAREASIRIDEGLPHHLRNRLGIDGSDVSDIAEIDRGGLPRALADVQALVARDYAAVGGVLMRRTRPAVLRWGYGSMVVETLGYRNFAGGVPTMRPFDGVLLRDKATVSKSVLSMSDMTVRIEDGGAGSADERSIVLSGMRDALAAAVEKDLADAGSDVGTCAALAGLRSLVRSVGTSGIAEFVEERASRSPDVPSGASATRNELAAAFAALRWLDVGRLSAAPRATVDALPFVLKEGFSVELAGGGGTRHVSAPVPRSIPVRRVSGGDHPVVAVLPGPGSGSSVRLALRCSQGRFYLPLLASGKPVWRRSVRSAWEDAARHEAAEDLRYATGRDAVWRESEALRQSEREKGAPFATARPYDPLQERGIEPFLPELVSIDDVVHRRIPEPCFALYPGGRSAVDVAVGWRGHALGGRTNRLCHSFLEADVVREMAVGRDASWASAVGSVEILDPSVFSADMRSRRADLVGRSVLEETVRRIPTLDDDGIAAMAGLRAMLAPVGRPDLADRVDAEAVLSAVSGLRPILGEPLDGDDRRVHEEVWRGDAAAMVDPGGPALRPDVVCDEDRVLAMEM